MVYLISFSISLWRWVQKNKWFMSGEAGNGSVRLEFCNNLDTFRCFYLIVVTTAIILNITRLGAKPARTRVWELLLTRKQFTTANKLITEEVISKAWNDRRNSYWFHGTAYGMGTLSTIRYEFSFTTEFSRFM